MVVTDSPVAVDVSPTNNAGAITLIGSDLDALPDDPDELQTDLTALAGPSAGPNGGQFYIDGFTAGQLPPKSAIREIRINSNPFSAQYDKVGYGRIEIFTKPGTDKWHGQVSVNANPSGINSKNPFFDESASESGYPSYYSVQYSGNMGGPLSKKASFFVSSDIRDINDLSIVNAQTLNTGLPEPFSAAVPCRNDDTTSRRNSITSSGRTTRFRCATSITATARTTRASADSPCRQPGYDTVDTENTVQVSDTQTFGSKSSTKLDSSVRDALNEDPRARIRRSQCRSLFRAAAARAECRWIRRTGMSCKTTRPSNTRSIF